MSDEPLDRYQMVENILLDICALREVCDPGWGPEWADTCLWVDSMEDVVREAWPHFRSDAIRFDPRRFDPERD